MSQITVRLTQNAEEICKLSAIAKRYVRGGAFMMAAAMFRAIDKLAQRSGADLEASTTDTIRANPRRKKYRAMKKYRKYCRYKTKR